MTDVPHLFVSVTVEMDGRVTHGHSADGLPPKWFTKNPDTTFEQDDLPRMLEVIRQAAETGKHIGLRSSFFQWWQQLYESQHDWALQKDIPTLLAGFGVSLMERAVLDALCRYSGTSLFEVLRNNVLEIDLIALRPSLGPLALRDVLPAKPSNHVTLRHTIGMGDVLSGDLVSGSDRPQDGLPFTLEENILAYGLRYFKIKLSGDLEIDRTRLTDIAVIITQTVGPDARITLDGNENYEDVAQFRQAWNGLRESPTLRAFIDQSLLFVEQPIHRSVALDASVGEQLQTWANAPPIIIDESDGELASLPTALSLGYRGTSHKNCKGIIKGLLAAATIAHQQQDENPLILSAEDLGNVGPVALLQDLAMISVLGICHVERNGHHYFKGLSMFPEEIQEEVLVHHSDLYDRHSKGFAMLAPRHGRLSLKSVNDAPFGLKPLLDMEHFDVWDF